MGCSQDASVSPETAQRAGPAPGPEGPTQHAEPRGPLPHGHWEVGRVCEPQEMGCGGLLGWKVTTLGSLAGRWRGAYVDPSGLEGVFEACPLGSVTRARGRHSGSQDPRPPWPPAAQPRLGWGLCKQGCLVGREGDCGGGASSLGTLEARQEGSWPQGAPGCGAAATLELDLPGISTEHPRGLGKHK